MQYIRKHPGWALVFVGLILIVALAAGAASQVVFREDTKSDVTTASEHRQEIVDAQVEDCLRDQKFRRQYRIRGKGEADVFRYFIKILPASPFAVDHPALAARAVAQFQADLDRIEVLPLPDCEQLRTQLENP